MAPPAVTQCEEKRRFIYGEWEIRVIGGQKRDSCKAMAIIIVVMTLLYDTTAMQPS
jgi:hypothetical protein